MRMTELRELRTLASGLFPEVRVGLPHLLRAWATSDHSEELEALLVGTGITIRRFASALDPLMSDPHPEDYAIITECLDSIASGVATGQDLLRAICCHCEHRVTETLAAAGLNVESLERNLRDKARSPVGSLAGHGINLQAPTELEAYGRDLTKLARKGEFDHLSDRSGLSDDMMDVLLRRQKCNVILIGEPGVGKTACVELLARRVAFGKVPDDLQEASLIELCVPTLVAGTKYRGEFEERMENVIKTVRKMPCPILFFDEMHLICGAGRAEGVTIDAANILKPHLARSGFRVIGATTVREYQRYIAPDQALARRFQEIRVEEPDRDTNRKMVSCQAKALVGHHGIKITEEIISRAIELTDKYLKHRRQPDKTVDLLDRCAALLRREGSATVIREADLLNLLARATSWPIGEMMPDERDWLISLPERLKERVIGQDHAIDAVTRTLIHRRQDHGDRDRCLGIFLFAGDTGVGKTELARGLAACFYDDEKALLHLDLAEYNEAASVNKLIGAPSGYVGSEKEGLIPQWLHTNGCGVLLFDEIEKAHPEVRLLLLGLLDSGRITSARGETLDASQCVVVLTTNAVTSRDLSRRGIGFGRSAGEQDTAEMLLKEFPPEFLGRLDEMILFNQLGETEMTTILRNHMARATERLQARKIVLVYEEDRLLRFLIGRLRSNRSGARGVARLVEKEVLQPVFLAALNHGGSGKNMIALDDLFYDTGNASLHQPDMN